MSITKRRFLYIFFILVFVIITPLVSLYASGYKLGDGFNLQKTGILIIDTQPEGAKIYIDGKLKRKFWDTLFNNDNYMATPVKLKNLKPGEYDIKLTKNGYIDWQKKLRINPGESTFIENIELFKNDIPIFLTDTSGAKTYLSPSKEKALIVSASSASVFKFEGLSSLILTPVSLINNPIWSQDEKSFINGSVLYCLDKKTPEKLGIGAYKSLKWLNDTEFLFLENNQLLKYSIKNGSIKKIISEENINGFDVMRGSLFVSINKDGHDVLQIYKSDVQPERTLPLPADNLKFTAGGNNKVLELYSPKNNLLYLIDPDSNYRPIREVLNNATHWEWMGPERLLYNNDHEIWLMDLINGSSVNKTLLTRISQKIDKTIWHPSNNYILYQFDNQINILELDKRDRYNISKLIQLPEINNCFLNSKGNLLFMEGRIGRNKGFYQLTIQ